MLIRGLHACAALPSGERAHLPLNKRLGGPRSLSGHFGKEINLLLLLVGRTFHRLVTLHIPHKLQSFLFYNTGINPIGIPTGNC
jgi:hypothetical protein